MHVSLDIDLSWSELGGATSVVASAEAVSALQVEWKHMVDSQP